MSDIAIKIPILTATPRTTLVDQPVQIRLSGCKPNQTILIRARSIDGSRNRFESHAVFHTDNKGEVNLDKQKPISGSYRTVDPMGLFWSMKLDDPAKHTLFTKTKAKPITIQLTAEINEEIIAEVDVIRSFAAPNIIKANIDEQGLIGALYQPRDSAPHPAVIILSGSDGGMREHAAALLASHGYAAFSLAYFGVEDVPNDLINIPLEYFENAIEWLQQRPTINGDQIAVIGFSRGAELALLLGTLFPKIKAIIAGSPSSHIFAGLRNFMATSEPAWTYQNKPLPYLTPKNSLSTMFSYFAKWLTRKPISNLSVFHKALKGKDNLDSAQIQVEKIQAPIMLISGGDDQLWPSSLFATMVMDRLSKKSHPNTNIHLHYEKAGHFLCFPFTLPSMPPEILLSNGPFTMTFGGNAQANAQAAADSWPKILAFLEESLK